MNGGGSLGAAVHEGRGRDQVEDLFGFKGLGSWST